MLKLICHIKVVVSLQHVSATARVRDDFSSGGYGVYMGGDRGLGHEVSIMGHGMPEILRKNF